MSDKWASEERPTSVLRDAAAPEYSARGVQHSASITHALNSLCMIAGRIASAPTALIAQRNPLTRTIQVRGRIGTLVNEVDMSFVLPDLNPDRQPIIVAPDIRHDRRFQDHPLLRLMPHMKSLIALLVPGCSIEHRAVLKVINPGKAAIADGYVHQMLSEVCATAGDVLSLERETPPVFRCSCQTSFLASAGSDANAAAGGLNEGVKAIRTSDMASSFLMETLVRKRQLHSRNSVDYMTLRSWRSTLKKYQISALMGLKAAPPPQFIAAVAEEITASVLRSHGKGGIRTVVPVPPGSSGGANALPSRLAHAVADRLGANVHLALAPAGTAEVGKSSPRKSGRLAPYWLSEPISGPILLVDDVASSGRHLELAVEACRAQCPAVHAVAWIGG